MAADPTDLFEELKRRKVFRATAAYVVVAAGVGAVANDFLPALGLPPWTVKFVVALAVLGLPVAIALSWAFDVRPADESEGTADGQPGSVGPVRTDGADDHAVGQRDAPGRPRSARWTTGRIAVVGAVLILALAGAAMLFTGGEQGPPATDHRVAVLPFENLTGDPELDDLGLAAADWISDGLPTIPSVEVVPITVVREVLADAGAGAALREVAQETRAGLAITGSFLLAGDSIEFRAALVDLEGQTVTASFRPGRSPRSEPTRAFRTVRQQAMGAVAVLLDQGQAGLVARAPPTYEAYQAYLGGIDHFMNLRYPEAVRELERAERADPGFLEPRLFALAALIAAGEPARADSVLRTIEPHHAELSEVGRLILETARADLRGNRTAAYHAALEWHERSPGRATATFAGLFAVGANRPREAVDLLEGVPFEDRDVAAGLGYYIFLTGSLHLLGEHGRELEAARQFQTFRPQYPTGLVREARALAALDRPAEAEALVDDLLLFPRSPPFFTPEKALQNVGDALAAFGHADGAQRVYGRALAYLKGRGPARPPDELLAHADLLRRIGRLEAAERYAAAALDSAPDDGTVQAVVGLIAAQQGDRAAADTAAAQIAARHDPYNHGSNTYNRARIRARLGDLDRAVELLRQAASEGWYLNGLDRLDPDLRPLRGHPVFEELMRPKG